MKILLIEDDVRLSDSLKTLLTAKGFQVETVYDGETGADYALLGIYDLLILDVMMPGLNGYQVARQVRAKRCNVPILMLTARSEVEDRIEGLNAGADYYMTKPFDTRELLACINALLRRQGDQVDQMVCGNTELDLATGILHCGDNSVRLSAKEFDVMRYLLQSGHRNLSKEVLLSRVWGYESNAVENHVEVYVGFLRKKLRAIGSNVRIESVRRLGYHLEVEAELRQVINILLDNGQKYANPTGEALLTLTRQGKKAVLRFFTPGQSMTTQRCKDIFQRFYRVDEARTASGSYGLGLSIAHNIIKSHGGRIWAEPAKDGNVFIVTLPEI